jgi:uncharacterized SAM-dependent methyltransferase
MHLVAREAQTVNIGEYRFAFERGESIHTENSYKYTVPEFAALAERAGFRAVKLWQDARALFSVHGLVAA